MTIEPVEPLDLSSMSTREQQATRKRVHSVAWHHETDKCKALGIKDMEIVKERCSLAAKHALQAAGFDTRD